MSEIQRWEPTIDWSAPAGQAIERLIDYLPRNRPISLTIFGSAPLQLAVDSGFLSADVDVLSDIDLAEFVQRAGLTKRDASVYIEQCGSAAFVAPPNWVQRACFIERGNVRIVLPHPIDILVSKLPRLEEKDMAAFRLVRRVRGEPTEDQLLTTLRAAVDLYRPRFDEERATGDLTANTQRVWRELFGREIDVRAEIIVPALEARQKSYGCDLPNYRDELREIGSAYSARESASGER